MVYPPYDSLYDGKVVNHAHNDYLEGLAETGVIGGLCCLWFLGVLLLNALKGMAHLGEFVWFGPEPFRTGGLQWDSGS